MKDQNKVMIILTLLFSVSFLFYFSYILQKEKELKKELITITNQYKESERKAEASFQIRILTIDSLRNNLDILNYNYDPKQDSLYRVRQRISQEIRESFKELNK